MPTRRPGVDGLPVVRSISPAEYAMTVANRMSEATFQAQLDGLGADLGWLCYHTHDSRKSQRGFLDWVAIRGPRLIFAELKVQSESRGKLSADQERWLERLRFFARLVNAAALLVPKAVRPSVEIYVWRPISITTDEIARILR